VEVERKFLVDDPPSLDGRESTQIEQGYLAIARGEGGSDEVRLRRRDGELTETVKRGGGLAREEAEIELDAERFERLWPLTEGRRLHKRRYVIPDGELTIELDVYAGALDGLIVAEVEFPDEGAAAAFEPPAWFAREVTGRTEYLNETLATEGRP
jgi:adenylate cyclase